MKLITKNQKVEFTQNQCFIFLLQQNNNIFKAKIFISKNQNKFHYKLVGVEARVQSLWHLAQDGEALRTFSVT